MARTRASTRLPPPTVPAMSLLLAVSLLMGGCSRSPRVAVIVMHGVTADARYLHAISDSFLSGPRPVRVEVFHAGGAADAWREALQRAHQVVETPGLVAVVGHRDSRSTLVVGPVYRDAGIPLLVPNATSRSITDIGPMVFRMVADDAEEGAFLARVVLKGMNGRRISIFHLSDEYGSGIRDGVLQALVQAGVKPWHVTQYGPQRTHCPDEFQPLVDASLLEGPPDVVVLGSRTPDAACIMRLVAARVPDVRFITADGVDPREALRAGAGPAADRLWLTQFWTPLKDSASAAFAHDYERHSGVAPDQGTALRWDGVRLLVDAVRQVGPSPRHIAAYMRELGHQRPPFHGITGDISFGPHPHTLIVVDAWDRPVPVKGW